MKKIGIFGGTFDPIHNGHLLMASLAVEEFKLDHMIFLPSGNPPHKDDDKVTDDDMRARLVESSIEGDPRFSMSTYEYDIIGKSYTVDTINYFLEKYPDCEFFFLMGGDSLRSFKSWYRSEEITDKVSLIVADRLSDEKIPIEKIAQELKAKKPIYILNMPLIELSSTEIRKRIGKKQSVKYMLAEKTLDIILTQGLYLNKEER